MLIIYSQIGEHIPGSKAKEKNKYLGKEESRLVDHPTISYDQQYILIVSKYTKAV